MIASMDLPHQIDPLIINSEHASSIKRASSPYGVQLKQQELCTDNFVFKFTDCQLNNVGRLLSPKPTITKDAPLLFQLQVYHCSDQKRSKSVWSTAEAGTPFVRAAVGDDQLTPGNGEYRIVQNNMLLTSHQSISYVGIVEAGQAFEGGVPMKKDSVVIAGQLLDLKQADVLPRRSRMRAVTVDASFNIPVPVLHYRMVMSERSSTELSIEIEIEQVSTGQEISDPLAIARPYDRIILQYSTSQDEEVFGLGEQFSYWSLKGQRVPIISREQGIGRGKQPLTYILNHIPLNEPAYSGADPLSTYTAIAHYITSHARSVYLHNSELSFFDFTANNKIQLEVASTQLNMTVFYGTRPMDLLKQYTSSISGRQSELPDWITGRDGAVIGIQGGESKVLEVVKKLTDVGIKIAAVWLQDWVGTRQQPLNMALPIPFLIPGFPGRSTAVIGIKATSPQKRLWWNWEYDRAAYPNWPAFVTKLRDLYNIKVMTYINPFLSDVTGGGKASGSFSRNYFQEASDLGYLVKRWVKISRSGSSSSLNLAGDGHVGPGGRELLEMQHTIEDLDGKWRLVDYLVSSGPGVSAGMIDLSNKNAFEWYKQLIKENMLQHGVSGWMADFAEYLPYDGVLHSQRNVTQPPDFKSASDLTVDNSLVDPHSFHNVYPREWARLNREAVDEFYTGHPNRTDIVFFMRSAYSDTPKYCNAFWNGDQLHTWDILDGLESSIYGSLNMGLSGIAFAHSDIGGYTTLNVDPKVNVQLANRNSVVRLPIIEKRLRYVRQDTELFYRWMEAGVFTSVAMYRTHEGSVPDENIQVWSDAKNMQTFQHFSLQFQKLSDYRSLLMQEHHHHGYPVLRPLYLHYPHSNRPAMVMERLQFMYGPLLLVIPITSPGIKTLNQKIQEPPADDDDNNYPDDSDNNELIATVDMPQDDLSSDEEDSFQQLKIGDAMSAKGRLMFNVRNWAAEGVLSTLRLLFKTLPMKTEMDDGPHASAQPGFMSKSVPKIGLPQAARRTEPISKSLSPTKQIGGQRSSAPNVKRSVVTVVAPKEVPKPHHGRPFLPAGRWTHLWTSEKFDVKDANGTYITEQTFKAIDCSIGKPGVFVRDINASEMRELLRRGCDGLRPRAGEDWRYWLDSIDGGTVQYNVASLTDQEFDDILNRAMSKFQLLREALEKFIEHCIVHELKY